MGPSRRLIGGGPGAGTGDIAGAGDQGAAHFSRVLAESPNGCSLWHRSLGIGSVTGRALLSVHRRLDQGYSSLVGGGEGGGGSFSVQDRFFEFRKSRNENNR